MTNIGEKIKNHREEAIETLGELRKVMFESQNWESWKPYIDAVTMGAFALARLNEIDFGEVEE